MSAKKSFDVRSSAPRKRTASTDRPDGKVVARKRSRDRRPLKVRKQEAFKRSTVLVIAGLVVLAGLVLFLLWRPEIRISKIETGSAQDPAALEAIARGELAGTYHVVFPRDSFFLYPERAIRAEILRTYPSASSVAITRVGFDTISIETNERLLAFVWCGTPGSEGLPCYQADAEGFIYAPAPVREAASSTPELEVYAELTNPEDMSAYPLRAQVQGAGSVPDILRFMRAVQSLGVLIERIAIRGDEADLISKEGVRITYLIGTEEGAAKDAAAAFPNLNFKDGSLEYVDLRFPGKVYLKRTAVVE